MVNSVLDAPKLSEVNSPIICALLNESMVRPLHNDLGIDTHNDGRVLLPEESDQKRLAVLGRLAKGTLIGVDAILECFGERSELWARGTVDRLTAKN